MAEPSDPDPDPDLDADPVPAARPRWYKWPLILLALAAVAALLWQALPRGAYPTDLSLIGQGRPALVLAHDPNYVSGGAVMELLNDVRPEFAGRVDFLVAHLALEDAQAFAQRHQASDGTVLLFDAAGQRVGLLRHPQSHDELRHALTRVLGP